MTTGSGKVDSCATHLVPVCEEREGEKEGGERGEREGRREGGRVEGRVGEREGEREKWMLLHMKTRCAEPTNFSGWLALISTYIHVILATLRWPRLTRLLHAP